MRLVSCGWSLRDLRICAHRGSQINLLGLTALTLTHRIRRLKDELAGGVSTKVHSTVKVSMIRPQQILANDSRRVDNLPHEGRPRSMDSLDILAVGLKTLHRFSRGRSDNMGCVRTGNLGFSWPMGR